MLNDPKMRDKAELERGKEAAIKGIGSGSGEDEILMVKNGRIVLKPGCKF